MANKNNKLRGLGEWLRGRYGFDELSHVLIVGSLALVVANVFLDSIIVSIITLAIIAVVWWRAASTDMESRENENEVFCEFLGPARPWLMNPVQAFKDARAYKYLKCPECGKRVRVPRGKGKIRVRCPECDNRFEARS